MKKVMLALAIGVCCCVAEAQGTPPSMASYSSRMTWEAAVRAGDSSARWLLAWAYAEQGDWTKAWEWIQNAAPGTDLERAYLKGWLAWRAGRPELVDDIMGLGQCTQSRCVRLRMNAYWDMSQWTKAELVGANWFEASKSGEAFRFALLAYLLSGNMPEFDRLLAAADWRISPVYAAWRDAITELVKVRANF